MLFADFDADARTDDQDTLVEAREITRVLGLLGYDAAEVRLGLDMQAAADRLRALSPYLVVNLVESIAGSDSLQYLGPALLDFLGLPYTGCPTAAVFLSANKVLAKRTLEAGGMATPPWSSLVAAREGRAPGEPPWIVKPVAEHASYGIEEDSIIGDLAALAARAAAPEAERFFVERFIEGRELNVSLLEGPRGLEVLPIAEIDFTGYPEGKPRIVGYRAKWEESSFEYKHSVRRFGFPPEDEAMLVEVRRSARCAWELFGLRGYARVDYRVDRSGKPWVLEVNTNPCLSPDAGFAAAAAEEGLSLEELLGRVIEGARRA